MSNYLSNRKGSQYILVFENRSSSQPIRLRRDIQYFLGYNFFELSDSTNALR